MIHFCHKKDFDSSKFEEKLKELGLKKIYDRKTWEYVKLRCLVPKGSKVITDIKEDIFDLNPKIMGLTYKDSVPCDFDYRKLDSFQEDDKGKYDFVITRSDVKDLKFYAPKILYITEKSLDQDINFKEDPDERLGANKNIKIREIKNNKIVTSAIIEF